MKRRWDISDPGSKLLFLVGILCLVSGPSLAQNGGATSDQGYKVGEKSQPAQATDKPATGDKQAAVETKRLARFDYVSGNVTWRADDGATWQKAKSNQPLHEGTQVWVTDGGRAEIRFDDGSLLRLGNGAVVTLQTVYGDTEGEFTQIKMVSGVLTLRPKQERAVFQVDTPFNTVKTSGPARVRIGVSDQVEVGVRLGKATIEGKPGKTVVHAGSYLVMRDAQAAYDMHNLPAEDSWERWNDERDHQLDPGYPLYRASYPVYVPGPSVWFGLDFPIGPVYHHGWWGRGVHWRR
jgi:hypothetical protein